MPPGSPGVREHRPCRRASPGVREHRPCRRASPGVRELEIGLDETVLIVTADRIVDHRIESALVRKKVTAAAEDPA